MSILDIVLASIALGLVLILVSLLAMRRLYRQFPVFFAYCLWTIAVAVIRFLFAGRPTPYFFVYWLTEATYLTLALLIMLLVLGPFTAVIYGRHPRSGVVIPVILFLVVGSSLLMALFNPIGGTAIGGFASAVYVFVILMCLLELALLIAALVITGRHWVNWSRYEAGILAGFGVLAFLTLVANSATILRLLNSSVPPQIEILFRYFRSGAFIVSAIAWLIAFWRPEPPTIYEPPDMRKYRELARLMREHTEILKRLLKRLGLHPAMAASLPDDHLLR